jgi:alpha-galactosidase
MKRSHFIRLSASAAAAIVFSRLTSFASNTVQLINLPDTIHAKSGEELFQLSFSNGIYTNSDIEVKLTQRQDALAVYISSPSRQLNTITLHWKYSFASSRLILGDQLERSYGDLGWQPFSSPVNHPWYILLNDGEQTACFGVKTGCNSLCSWTIHKEGIALTLDVSSGGVGVQLGQRQLHAADIVTMQGNGIESAFATAQLFCKRMCPHPRLPKQPVYGINDWYFAYGNNSSALIKEITSLMTGLATDNTNRPFSVIDAGWATYSPLLPDDGGFMEDFSKPNAKFKDMAAMADDIKKLGMQPGLWTRPLCARHDDKASLLLPSIPGRDDPRQPILDPTITENIERVKYNISTYKKWGYQLVKHDYSTYDILANWGFQMKNAITTPGWRFYDQTKTTAEVMNELYQAIREAAGDMYIIGCNTVSHLSAGVFELNRIGDDTSGKEWERTRKMGVNTLGFRIPQHNAFYATDADCVGLTNDIPWARNKQWMQLVAESSTPLFISPDPKALGREQQSFIKDCFAKAAAIQPIGEPLDWMSNNQPAKWKLNGRKVDFDWG